MEAPNWSEERAKLRARFASGDITVAKRKDLERYLVVLANTPFCQGMSTDQKRHEIETEAYATIVRHLLMIQLGEELHAKSHRIAIWALMVSVLAAAFAGLLWLADLRKPDVKPADATAPPVLVAPAATVVSNPSAPSTKQTLPSPTTQFAPYIATTNPIPVPSTVSTNR